MTIPDTINGLPVIRIGNYGFSGRNSLASVTIPDSVPIPEGVTGMDGTCRCLESLTGEPVWGGFAGCTARIFFVTRPTRLRRKQ